MNNFEDLAKRYLELFPEEAGSLSNLHNFLSFNREPEKRVARTNYQGHITASCLFFDAVRQSILLFFHPAYRLILQPGGHFKNAAESPLDVATRKLFDETPYTQVQSRYLPWDYDSLVPFDIDSHHIPANQSLGERAHIHHDFRYVFLSTAAEGSSREIEARGRGPNGKSYSYMWYDLSELSRWATFGRVYTKLHKFLGRDSARRRFYLGLTSAFRPTKEVNTIIVTHVLPDSFDFLDALSHCTNLIGVIPKPKSIHKPTMERLVAAGVKILSLSRQEVVQQVSVIIKENKIRKTVLLDIGGWFSAALNELSEDTSECIAGIVEDTRNGQDKYEAVARLGELPVPVVSVAESALKANEDFLVGQSVVFSADAILREHGLVLEYLRCGVIGYGKIGRSIAHHLQLRGIKPYVVEKRPLRLLEAYRERCEVRSRDWVSNSVDVVFCATGSRATDIIDFRSLRPGVFMFSVTSSDDEFDLSLLPGEYLRTEISQYVSRYDSSHNYFYLVNDGNAVNFLHQAVLWEFIQLVKGGIFVALRNLADGRPMSRMFSTADKGPGFSNLFELGEDDQSALARLWMETVLLGVKLET